MARATSAAGAISGRVLLRLVDFVARAGHDPDALCRAAGLRRAALAEPGARVPYALAERLGARAVAATGDPNLGLHLALGLGEQIPHDAGALMLMASPTVRAALDRMVRYQNYWGDGPRSALAPAPGGLAVRYGHPWSEGELRRHAARGRKRPRTPPHSGSPRARRTAARSGPKAPSPLSGRKRSTGPARSPRVTRSAGSWQSQVRPKAAAK